MILNEEILFQILNLITPSILWIAWWIVLGISLFISLALFFHWKKYSFGNAKFALIGLIYFVGIVVLLGASVVVLIFITN